MEKKSIFLRVSLTALTLSSFVCFNTLQAQQDTTEKSGDLYDMDLESLMNIEITTASKKMQNINEAPAAIFVITKEDLQFYGANNIGEALRMVPGIEIVQGGDQNYEITTRGLSRSVYNTSNKILWLLDGRSINNDALGGIRIESIPVSIDDIERIEVIRGAGSSLYGANAFQGIINIITKSPSEQDGVQAKVAYGNLNQMNSNVRFGQKLNKFSYKVTVGYDNIDKEQKRFSGLSQNTIDSLKDMGQVEGLLAAYYQKYENLGMKYQFNNNASLGLNGGFSDNYADHYFVIPGGTKYKDYFGQINYLDKHNTFRAFFNGQSSNDGYMVGKFLKKTEPSDLTNPVDQYLLLNGRKKYSTLDNLFISNQILDFEYQRSFQFGEKVSAILGGSYRKNIVEGNMFSSDGELKTEKEDISAIFTQIEYHPIEKLNFILGGRFDYNSIVGQNFNPRIAAIYNLTSKQTLRLGYGTATRNPLFLYSYLDANMKAGNLNKITGLSPVYNLTTGSDYIVFNISGNKKLKPEKITSYEIGYQVNFGNKVQCRIDGFYNQMSNPIDFGTVSVMESVQQIENLHSLGFGSDLSALAPYNGGVDPSVPNILNANDMQDQIDELKTLANTLRPFDPTTAAQLDQMAGGLAQLQPLYGTPTVMHFDAINKNDKYTYYGGEIGFTFIPTKNISITANYAYLSFSDSYRSVILNDSYHIYSETQTLTTTSDAVHKINLGLKYHLKSIYFGTMFNFMSEETFPYDNNKNGMYDIGDRDNYSNKGLYTIDPRMNLTVNLGYKIKSFDFFVTGYNLIQDDYLQLPASYASTAGDNLHTRYMGGVRVNF